MLTIIIVSKITYCEYKYSSWFPLDLAFYSMNLLISDNSLAPSQIRKKKYQIKNIELRTNIIPRKIYANFLPIKAVSGSSFTLIFYPKFLNKSITF